MMKMTGVGSKWEENFGGKGNGKEFKCFVNEGRKWEGKKL